MMDQKGHHEASLFHAGDPIGTTGSSSLCPEWTQLNLPEAFTILDQMSAQLSGEIKVELRCPVVKVSEVTWREKCYGALLQNALIHGMFYLTTFVVPHFILIR